MIRRIVLENWQCFRGRHVIRLEPRAYAITASYESDPQHSNWGGKSALLEAVDFAVRGTLNKDRKFDADGWITRGEKQGSVKLVFGDQTRIERSRVRGSSTQVRFTYGDAKASQAEAAARILKHLKIDSDDFPTVAYFAQGAMARLIRTEPEKRFDVIRSWLGLAKAEEAETLAGDRAIKHTREVQKLKGRLNVITQLLDEGKFEEITGDVIAHEIKALRKLEAKRDETNKLYEASKLKLKHEMRVEQYEDSVEQRKKFSAEIKEYPADLKERYEDTKKIEREKHLVVTEATKLVASKKLVARGQFDGSCPVADILCPVRKKINEDRDASAKVYNEAVEHESKAVKNHDAVKVRLRELEARVSVLTRKEHTRDLLKAQTAKLHDEVEESRAKLKKMDSVGEVSREELEELSAEIHTKYAHIGQLEAKKKQGENLREERDSLMLKVNEEAKLAAIATQTRSIFRAAQRRVAERALDDIGNRANEMLAKVDLNLDVRWEREGKNLAKACEMCGMAFPSSERVKQCETCGAPRGQNVIQRLEFVLSDRSGAADDFGGIALQLGAGSWLLNARESSWETAMIDEPFSQMDRPVRHAAAKQLLSLLGTSSFKQVFVISHSQETVDMYGAKVEIRVARDGSRTISVV